MPVDADFNVISEKNHWHHLADGVIDLLAGTAGGTAGVYVGQPLDTVKVKMQTFPSLYSNGVRCFLETLRKDGVMRGLYAGTVPALAANISENAILFAAYGFCQKAVASLSTRPVAVSDLSPFQNACAGSLAAVFSSFALCPTELIKCRLQALREVESTGSGAMSAMHRQGTGSSSIGPFSLTRQIIREDGFLGLFRGLTPTFAREVPGYFFFFGGYELSRAALTPPGKTKDDIGVLKTIFCGGVGGVALWTAIFPADVIKSRVQVQGSGSFVGTLKTIVREDGFKALYKGLGPTLIRSFFATGVLFVAYEWTKRGLHQVVDPVLGHETPASGGIQ